MPLAKPIKFAPNKKKNTRINIQYPSNKVKC